MINEINEINKLVNIAKTPTKIKASENFIGLMSSFDYELARIQMSGKRSKSAGEAYKEALKFINDYQLNPDVKGLEKAAMKFIEVLEFNINHTASIMYLSYTFYALGNERLALKYIEMSESINPVYSTEFI